MKIMSQAMKSVKGHLMIGQGFGGAGCKSGLELQTLQVHGLSESGTVNVV